MPLLPPSHHLITVQEVRLLPHHLQPLLLWRGAPGRARAGLGQWWVRLLNQGQGAPQPRRLRLQHRGAHRAAGGQQDSSGKENGNKSEGDE